MHHSRSRKGYHVFLSWYFGKYNSPSDEEKHDIFRFYSPTMVGNLNYNKSLESVSIPPEIHAYMVMRAAASLWKASTREYQDGWVDRANKLNIIPLRWSFKELPTEIFADGIEYNVRLSLQSYWMYVVKRLWEMIIKVPQRHILSLKYRFGRE